MTWEYPYRHWGKTQYPYYRQHLYQERPYKHDSTASRLLSEVKHVLARSTVGDHVGIPSVVLCFYIFIMHQNLFILLYTIHALHWSFTVFFLV